MKKKKFTKYKVGIIGCGAIFKRHLESIESNVDFELIAICDIQKNLVDSISKKLNVPCFNDYKEMITKTEIDFVVIATPNSLHYEQSIFCLENGCDVLIEKPVSFKSEDVKDIINCAKKHDRQAYCVLQVRLNTTVLLLKEVLKSGILGNIRSVSFVQRWQRPIEYFTGWRSVPEIGGGTLYEVGIHYIDILQFLFGVPKIHSSKVYNTKHKDVEIEDTIYSILDFGDFGGTCEVTISSEPTNLECSISVSGSNGFVKIGGKSLNIVESAVFLSHGSRVEFQKIQKKYEVVTEPNNYGSYEGSCPNHPLVYSNLNEFNLSETINVIDIIDNIYSKSSISYKIKKNND